MCDVQDYIGNALSRFNQEIFAFLRIPSISAKSEHDEDTRQRMDAATWLADRGFGKPTVAPAPIMEPDLHTFTIDIDPNRNMDNPFNLPEDML